MNAWALLKIFLRSFFIQTSLNLRRMQNLGFIYAVMPLIKEKNLSENEQERFLARHLQMFNTNPYLSAPLIGSIVRMEEEDSENNGAAAIDMVKKNLAGPYAAIGDTFFWGALRPCAGILAATTAVFSSLLAPLTFLLIFTPAHLLVRSKGFIESYRRGKLGIEFVRKMDLLNISTRLKWISLVIVACFCGSMIKGGIFSDVEMFRIAFGVAGLAVVLLCWYLIKQGVSQIYILYGATILVLILSSREWLMCWK